MKRTKQIIIYTLIAISTSMNVQAQSKSKIFGTWYNVEQTAKIEIMKIDREIIGKIIWIDQQSAQGEQLIDVANSDSTLRARPLMGLTILKARNYKKGVWQCGQVYDPESGIAYACEVMLKGKDVLEVKGFLGDSWVSRTVEWNRVEE
jgi:uncharacterized protein (DUF2147 family)